VIVPHIVAVTALGNFIVRDAALHRVAGHRFPGPLRAT
jgi:hypothetical protein